MNERIRELAEQAGLKVESWMTNPPKPFQIFGSTEQFEKFAELIVKEMLQTCEDHPAWTGRMIGEQIKQHFGVKL